MCVLEARLPNRRPAKPLCVTREAIWESVVFQWLAYSDGVSRLGLGLDTRIKTHFWSRSRSRPASRFENLGGKYIFRGQGFVFIMFKTKFSVHNKIWGALPPNNPGALGLSRSLQVSVQAYCLLSRDFEYSNDIAQWNFCNSIRFLPDVSGAKENQNS